MSRIPISVIGLGNAFVPHGKALANLSDRVEVRWAAARSAARTEVVAREYGFPVTTEIDRAIEDKDVRAVLLLTPPDSHLDLARRCFAAGKHVLCEKPLEISVARAEALIDAARDAGKLLGAVLQMRYREDAVRLRHALDAGELGEIQAATMSVPWWRPQSYYDDPGRGTLWRDGGGVLITQAIHTIDLFRWFVGIREVNAARTMTTRLHRMEAEDFVAALITLDNGAPGVITATVAAYPGSAESIQIIGTKGTARLEGGALHLAFLDGREEHVGSAGGSGSGANVMGFSHAMHRQLISAFVDAVETGRPPAVTAEEALATQRVVEEIMRQGARK